MIQWREQPVDSGAQPLDTLYRSLPLTDVLRIVAALQVDRIEPPLLIVAHAARTRVLAHLRSSQAELGGLLIGEAFSGDAPAAVGEVIAPAKSIAVVRVSEALPGDDHASTAISLQLGASVWNKARERLGNGRLVVGWYHSHPHLGAFFSGTDRRTQRAFFAQPYSVGWVIDPYATDRASVERFYLGPRARELDAGVIATSHAGL